jgi:hypothetical protein
MRGLTRPVFPPLNHVLPAPAGRIEKALTALQQRVPEVHVLSWQEGLRSTEPRSLQHL